MSSEETPFSEENQENEEEVEVSSKEMINNLLTDESLNDILLKGTDGGTVGANRFVLAARSLVFKRMLFGDFQESGKSVVPLGYHSSVLKALVEYIHTDTAQILEHHNNTVETLVSLVGAAMYYRFPGLSRKTKLLLMELLTSNPSLSCAVLEACKEAGPSVPKEVTDLAWKNIRTNAKGAIDGVAFLSADLMEEILKDDEMEVYEYQLFQMLQQWASSYGGGDHTTTTASKPLSAHGDRHEIASKMTEHIRLERIDAVFLSTVVEVSGLVSQSRLFELYKQKALAPPENSVISNWLRKVPSWKVYPLTPGTLQKGILDFPPIKTGIYRWTILIEDAGDKFYCGITTRSRTFVYQYSPVEDKIRLFDTRSGYGPWRDDLKMLKYGEGSKITFVLNLDPSDCQNGTLCASVDGKPTAQLFSGLHDYLSNNNRINGWVPTFCSNSKKPAQVRLINIEEVSEGYKKANRL